MFLKLFQIFVEYFKKLNFNILNKYIKMNDTEFEKFFFYPNLLENLINKEEFVFVKKYKINFENIPLIKFNIFKDYHNIKENKKVSCSKDLNKDIKINIVRYYDENVILGCINVDIFPYTENGTVFFVDIIGINKEFYFKIILKENEKYLENRKKELKRFYNKVELNILDEEIMNALTTYRQIFLCPLKYDIDIEIFILDFSYGLKKIVLLENQNKAFLNLKNSSILEWKVFDIIEQYIYES